MKATETTRRGIYGGHATLPCRACYSTATWIVWGCPVEEEYVHCFSCGLTSRVFPVTTVRYDREYVADRYDRYTTTDAMSALRLTLVESVTGVRAGRLLDVGYGNGSFIRHATANGWDAYGCDVNTAPYEGVRRVALPSEGYGHGERYDVITFFDSLEHFESLQEVRKVCYHADWIVVSCPCPPDSFPLREYISECKWRHLRPGEHHHHFTANALEALFTLLPYAADVVYVGNDEDAIRGARENGEQNIMTVVIQCNRR